MDFKYKVIFLIFVSECASTVLRKEFHQDFLQREKREIQTMDTAEGETIEATGGGIVREWSNVTLSLYIGGFWDR